MEKCYVMSRGLYSNRAYPWKIFTKAKHALKEAKTLVDEANKGACKKLKLVRNENRERGEIVGFWGNDDGAFIQIERFTLERSL